ncbi:MAG: hypothetical protein AAF497_23000, partial [Planctomycetota bacterium]
MKYEPIRMVKGSRQDESHESKSSRRAKSSRSSKNRKAPTRKYGDSFGPDGRLEEQSDINGTFEGTVIYVHGIANKPKASILKCQWDRALFGNGMGQRTRMVYWVNRDRYPDPFVATCNDHDLSEGGELGGDREEESLVDETRSMRMELAARQAERLLRQNDAIGKRKVRMEASLRKLAEAIESNAIRGRDSLQGLFPSWARDRLTRTFTRLLLNDVYDYFFDARKGQEIDNKFWSRLNGGGPYVVIGHCLGSVIAYCNLCQANRLLGPGSVRLFVT